MVEVRPGRTLAHLVLLQFVATEDDQPPGPMVAEHSRRKPAAERSGASGDENRSVSQIEPRVNHVGVSPLSEGSGHQNGWHWRLVRQWFF
jgi:hypothetical protein